MSENKLDDAALWLTQNAIPAFSYGSQAAIGESNDSFNLKAIEVRAANISMCVIDDCGDADLPILEISFSDLHHKQYLNPLDNGVDAPRKASLKCVLASDYYNRILSGWEPIIEPWE